MASQTQKNTVTKVTVGLVLSWIFGVSFLLSGLGFFFSGSYIVGPLIILCAILIIPYFDNVIAKHLHFEISGGIKVVLAILIIVLATVAESDSEETIVVQPNQAITEKEASSSEQKIKSATLTLDRVTEVATNLDKIRLTISNTGDVSIRPKFDVTVKDSSGKVVCEGSPLWGISSISKGETKTDEIQVFCTLGKDGDYTVTVDLLDEDFTKLSSASKTLTVSFWGKFGVN